MDANFIQQAELQNRQNSRKTADDAFRVVFGKEQPNRLRCYGRSVTTISLKKDEEINNLKQKHANEITSLKEELREEMRHLFTQLLQKNPGLNFQDIPGCVGSNLASPVDASSVQVVRGINLPHSSGSAHDSILQKVFCISHSLLIVCILLSIYIQGSCRFVGCVSLLIFDLIDALLEVVHFVFFTYFSEVFRC
ncbi:hypothetical protein RDI58_020163 [Solanum bulbocastanum]|uniref:Uncharacterized protein n=1 Tax=Solanum bulbocastanum TaxID=147425 RepID=A0AAN8Y7M4_SOLBU